MTSATSEFAFSTPHPIDLRSHRASISIQRRSSSVSQPQDALPLSIPPRFRFAPYCTCCKQRESRDSGTDLSLNRAPIHHKPCIATNYPPRAFGRTLAGLIHFEFGPEAAAIPNHRWIVYAVASDWRRYSPISLRLWSFLMRKRTPARVSVKNASVKSERRSVAKKLRRVVTGTSPDSAKTVNVLRPFSRSETSQRI